MCELVQLVLIVVTFVLLSWVDAMDTDDDGIDP